MNLDGLRLLVVMWPLSCLSAAFGMGIVFALLAQPRQPARHVQAVRR